MARGRVGGQGVAPSVGVAFVGGSRHRGQSGHQLRRGAESPGLEMSCHTGNFETYSLQFVKSSRLRQDCTYQAVIN
jgi:hypothetical protein